MKIKALILVGVMAMLGLVVASGNASAAVTCPEGLASGFACGV